ncbi:hypothetical protein D3C80_867170 [compost metagenome]
MEAILNALSKDQDSLIQNVELVGWISKCKRKAEFGIMEASHVSGPTVLSAKSEAIVEQVKEDSRKQAYSSYVGHETLSDATLLLALEYKAEHTLECGSLTEEESAVLNEAMTKKLFGGL